jgi:hypothetical protein
MARLHEFRNQIAADMTGTTDDDYAQAPTLGRGRSGLTRRTIVTA